MASSIPIKYKSFLKQIYWNHRGYLKRYNTLDQIGPESNGNEKVPYISQISSLVLYFEHPFCGGVIYPSAGDQWFLCLMAYQPL